MQVTLKFNGMSDDYRANVNMVAEIYASTKDELKKSIKSVKKAFKNARMMKTEDRI